jgi:hypothetical protein
MRTKILAAAVAVALSGCATPYQSMGFTGGVEAQQVLQDTWRIVARGNGYTSATRIQDYVLLKAAETTIANGGTHFVVLNSADRTNTAVGQTPGSVSTTVVGHTAFSTVDPGVSYNIVKPGEDTMIKIITVKAGETAPAGALAADQIVQFVGPRVHKA